MNKIVKIRYILALALCFVCITGFAFSQEETENCKGNCPNTDWMSGYYKIHRNCSSTITTPCRIDVYFQYRECNCDNGPVCREFRINEIRIPKQDTLPLPTPPYFETTNNDYSCYCFKNGNWDNLDIMSLMYEAQYEILKNSVDLFGLIGGQVNGFPLYNITKNCWSFWETTLATSYSPCNAYDCCVIYYYIVEGKKGCMGVQEFDHVYNSYNTSSTYTCSIQGGQTCIYTCGTYVLPDTYFNNPKISINEESDNKTNSINPIKIVPNPIINTIDFYIDDNQIKGLAKLKIYNDLGELVVTKSFIKSESSMIINIDFQNYSKGLYIYNIEFENNITFSGKFIKE